jgi:hypothetical protein
MKTTKEELIAWFEWLFNYTLNQQLRHLGSGSTPERIEMVKKNVQTNLQVKCPGVVWEFKQEKHADVQEMVTVIRVTDIA